MRENVGWSCWEHTEQNGYSEHRILQFSWISPKETNWVSRFRLLLLRWNTMTKRQVLESKDLFGLHYSNAVQKWRKWGQKLKQGRPLETGADAQPLEGIGLLRFFPWLAQLTFFLFYLFWYKLFYFIIFFLFTFLPQFPLPSLVQPDKFPHPTLIPVLRDHKVSVAESPKAVIYLPS